MHEQISLLAGTNQFPRMNKSVTSHICSVHVVSLAPNKSQPDSLKAPLHGFLSSLFATLCYSCTMQEDRALSLGWRLIHWIIILNFAIQVVYGGYMVFVVMKPVGVTGPLWAAAQQLPHEFMMVRRAYALETWMAIVGLSLYVGITEILPRRLQAKEPK